MKIKTTWERFWEDLTPEERIQVENCGLTKDLSEINPYIIHQSEIDECNTNQLNTLKEKGLISETQYLRAIEKNRQILSNLHSILKKILEGGFLISLPNEVLKCLTDEELYTFVNEKVINFEQYVYEFARRINFNKKFNNWLLDKNAFNKTEEDHNITANDNVLYIYKGNIKCHKYNHNIISATALLHNISDKDIEINVEYCKDCGKYLLSYDQFLLYREKHGVLIGNFKIVTNDFFEGETDLAEESPLHLSGYNVGQKDGFVSKERHYILARIIHDGIMTKSAVLNYLSYFVRMNGARRNMELAVSKWKEDITFVQNYNMSMQPSTIITKIKRY